MAHRVLIVLSAFATAFVALLILIPSIPLLPRQQVQRPALPPDTITIFYTCDTRGHMTPCNCSAGVAGGLARRKTFIASQRMPESLIVDAGNVTAGHQPWDLLEFDYILRGYQQMGYHAVNVGKREIGLSAKTLGDLNAKYPFFVSTNVVDSSGNRLFPAYRIVSLSNGFRVAVLGVVDNTLSRDELGEGVAIAPPEESLAKSLPSARQEADFLVLLAFASEQVIKEVADRYFEIDVIVGGDVEQPSPDAIAANKSTLVYVTDKGKSVGRLDLRYVGGKYVAERNTITTLLANIADDPQIAALVTELQQKQVANNYPTQKDDEDGLTAVSKGI